MPEKQPYQYRRGQRARLNRKKITECPYGDLTSKILWKGGWYDKDKELRGTR